MVLLGCCPACRFLPFALLGALMAFVGYTHPASAPSAKLAEQARMRGSGKGADREQRTPSRNSLKTSRDRALRRQAASITAAECSHSELAHRVAKMRKKFAAQYGFVVPEIKLDRQISPSRRSPIVQASTAPSWPPARCAPASIWCCRRRRSDARSAGRGDASPLSA
jgi:flagellar biosynthesis protein FlhA